MKKDEVREATAAGAWQLWTAEWNRFARLRQHGPALVFPAEKKCLTVSSSKSAARKSCLHCATEGLAKRFTVEVFFFCSTLLRCDLHKKKVPGRTPYSQHIMIRNWT